MKMRLYRFYFRFFILFSGFLITHIGPFLCFASTVTEGELSKEELRSSLSPTIFAEGSKDAFEEIFPSIIFIMSGLDRRTQTQLCRYHLMVRTDRPSEDWVDIMGFLCELQKANRIDLFMEEWELHNSIVLNIPHGNALEGLVEFDALLCSMLFVRSKRPEAASPRDEQARIDSIRDLFGRRAAKKARNHFVNTVAGFDEDLALKMTAFHSSHRGKLQSNDELNQLTGILVYIASRHGFDEFTHFVDSVFEDFSFDISRVSNDDLLTLFRLCAGIVLDQTVVQTFHERKAAYLEQQAETRNPYGMPTNHIAKFFIPFRDEFRFKTD